MIMSLLLGLGSMVVALLGLKCIKIGSATDQSKAKIAVGGGVLSMLAGELNIRRDEYMWNVSSRASSSCSIHTKHLNPSHYVAMKQHILKCY